jgi:hypothetical protein
LTVKILLIVSMGFALILGTSSRNPFTRKMIFYAIAGFAALFAAVALSNFVTIFSSLAVQ